MVELTEHVREYISLLTDSYPAIHEIWLIGSRANSTAREDSDWDLLVFGDPGIFEALEHDVAFYQGGINLLVFYNEAGDFCCPWGSKKKKGDLKDWKWEKKSDSLVTYEGKCKRVNYEEIEATESDLKKPGLKGYRVFPNDASFDNKMQQL